MDEGRNGERVLEAIATNDIAPLADVLARSFLDDPALAWMVPDQQTRLRTLPGFFRGVLRGTLRHGLVLHAPNSEAVSLWRMPGSIYPGLRETLVGLPSMLPFLELCGQRAQVLGKAVRDHAPATPFRYLQFVGVAPERQGRGLGGAVIRAGLHAAKQAGDCVYLETPKQDNVSLYLHHGFEIVGEWGVEKCSLRFTSMLKRPE